MIKGINKQVLEILETNNEYFEKALFFVKPEFSAFSENKLKELARNEINSELHPIKTKTKFYKVSVKNICTLIATFITGAVLGFLIAFVL